MVSLIAQDVDRVLEEAQCAAESQLEEIDQLVQAILLQPVPPEATQMEHPRHCDRLLQWTRIVDFYHATEYLAKLARVLFDDSRAVHGWQRRMPHWLKREPNAVLGILHSAAKHHSELSLDDKQEDAYWKAYQYSMD